MLTYDETAGRLCAANDVGRTLRLAEPAQFAAMVTFLASEQASYITGQSIAVDGGWIRSLL
jgi:NAD(P)-dependent dehydrogenase (short-subunit alcohol dehydrogenase family)